MKHRLKSWHVVFLLFLIIGTIYVFKGHTPEVYHTNSGNIFGTTYNIKYQASENLHEDIKRVLLDVDNSLSMFNKSSIISAFNSNKDTTANEMFTDVFNLAQEVSVRTDGAFDITVAPLVNAWGFGFKKGQQPDNAAVKEMLEYIGYKSVALVDGKLVKQDKRTTLDCSAIAKGYGCDAVARMLDKKGVENYMIEIGGEVVTKGKNDRGEDWTIAISKPIEDATASSNEHQAIISISGRGMATSGNYRNYYEIDGKKFAHTIDPRTGYPVQHSLLSATVIAGNCAKADAYATAFMVTGLEQAIELCKSDDIEAFFIYADEGGKLQTIATEGFNKYIK